MSASNASAVNPIVNPIVNLNGDSPKTLLSDYMEVVNALDKSIWALSKATPHGRNYPTGAQDYKVAREEHKAQRQMLVDIRKRYTELAIGISNHDKS